MKRPKCETFCPFVPFDQNVCDMDVSALREYTATLPTGEFPPLRWAGDGMDARPMADGAVFGPAPAAETDDFAALFAEAAPGAWREISNRTIVDLASVIQAYERRAGERFGPDHRRWPTLVLTRCLVQTARLENLTVSANVRILTCVFLIGARFTFTHFTRGVDLLGSLFAEEADFTCTRFDEHAHFAAVTFLRGVRFHETRFEGDVRFNETAFNEATSFEHARFAETVDLSQAIFQGTAWIDLYGLRVAGRSSLTGDLHLRLDQIEGRILGERGERLSAPEQPVPESRREQAESLQYAADQYNMLAGNFAGSSGPGAWRAADWCHSQYLDLRRRIAWLRGSWWEWLKDAFFKICLGNGIWLKYPIELAVVVILGFGLVYGAALPHEVRADANVIDTIGLVPHEAAGGRPSEGDVCSLSDIRPAYARILTAMYYSCITFTTVGYGDWHPVGIARLFAAIEAMSGITIMSAFTVILVRKIIR